MSKLQDIIDGSTIPIVNGRSYKWQELFGSAMVQKFVDRRDKVRTVSVDRSPDIGYACSLQETQEAFEYANGDILLLGTFSDFAGTFASHDLIVVKIFALTPLRP